MQNWEIKDDSQPSQLGVYLPKLRYLQDRQKTEKKVSANKNKSFSATLPGNGTRKVLDNPQVQGVIVVPFDVEVLSVEPTRSKR